MRGSAFNLSTNPDEVNFHGIGYRAMSSTWKLIHDLQGGTRAMREAGQEWLPREQEEDPAVYQSRLNRSILFEAYSDALESLSGRPFIEPVSITDLPEELVPMIENADSDGTGITSFCSSSLKNGVDYGVTHIFVDFPILNIPNPTKKDDNNRVPYFYEVPPPNLLWVRRQDKKLVTVAIISKELVPEGKYGEKEAQVIRVYDVSIPGKGYVEQWQLDEKENKFSFISRQKFTLNYIPLFTFYAKKTGYLTGSPALEGLAWLNIGHWQSMSDFRNMLRFASIGILAAIGVRSDEIKQVVVSPNRVVKFTNPNADMKYVEYGGKALDAAIKSISDLEDKMQRLGLQPFMMTTSNRETATAKSIDETRSSSDILNWVRAKEICIRHCFRAAADWKGLTLPDTFRVDIFDDFSLPIKASDDLRIIDQGRARGDISHVTYIKELKRRGTLSDALIAEVEVASAREELPFTADLPEGVGDES